MKHSLIRLPSTLVSMTAEVVATPNSALRGDLRVATFEEEPKIVNKTKTIFLWFKPVDEVFLPGFPLLFEAAGCSGCDDRVFIEKL